MADAPRLTAALTDLITAVTQVATLAGAAAESDRPEFATAKTLGISGRTLRRLVREGQVRGYSVGREIHVRRSDWDAWIAAQEMKPSAARQVPAQLRRAPTTPTCADDDLALLTAGVAQ